MHLGDRPATLRFLIHDRDPLFTTAFGEVFKGEGLRITTTLPRTPRMNAICERVIGTLRRELLDRTLIWNQQHLLHALRESGQFYNCHRPHQGIANARPLRALPSQIPLTDVDTRLRVRRHDRLGGILHEYRHAA